MIKYSLKVLIQLKNMLLIRISSLLSGSLYNILEARRIVPLVVVLYPLTTYRMASEEMAHTLKIFSLYFVLSCTLRQFYLSSYRLSLIRYTT